MPSHDANASREILGPNSIINTNHTGLPKDPTANIALGHLDNWSPPSAATPKKPPEKPMNNPGFR